MRDMIQESQKNELEQQAKEAMQRELEQREFKIKEEQQRVQQQQQQQPNMVYRGGGGGMRSVMAGPTSSTSNWKPTYDAGKHAPASRASTEGFRVSGDVAGPTSSHKAYVPSDDAGKYTGSSDSFSASPLVEPAPQTVQSSSQPTSPTVKSSSQPTSEQKSDPFQKKADKQLVPSEPEEDYTKIPTELDRKFEILDEDSALRPTIIKPGTLWTKSSQVALLAQPKTSTVSVDQQVTERNRAYDLLDALTKSGCLSIDQASLHVVMAATHCFDKTLIDTVIRDNVNPIEKVERSALIIATTIHNKPAIDIVKPEQVERVSKYSPVLFGLPPAPKYDAITLPQQMFLPISC
jgi:hypothetical protein